MSYNYWKLVGKMKSEKITQEELAKHLGRNPATISKKIHGHAIFTQKEIGFICDLLNIPVDEIPDYFFAQ